MSYSKRLLSFVLLLSFIFVYCNTAEIWTSPPGYDFNTPEKRNLSYALKEISGISFLQGDDQTLYAIEDESGKLYTVPLGAKKLSHAKFAGKADYEDISISGKKMISLLISNGTILQFPASALGKEKIDKVAEFKSILPKGEYEGMFADEENVYVLCKECAGDKETKEISLFVLQQNSPSSLVLKNTQQLKFSKIQDKQGKNKEKFRPSALARHPLTKDWYVISSVNKMLLIFDEAWKMKTFYSLNPSLFKQPEGLTFNSKGDLFISNEAAGGEANILSFKYRN